MDTSRPLLIAGSRSITDYTVLCAALKAAAVQPSCVVSGCAPGVDRLGERWAAAHGLPVVRFPAQWERFGRSAGFQRNTQMALFLASCPSPFAVLLWDGLSRGTVHMLHQLQACGVAGRRFTHQPHATTTVLPPPGATTTTDQLEAKARQLAQAAFMNPRNDAADTKARKASTPRTTATHPKRLSIDDTIAAKWRSYNARHAIDTDAYAQLRSATKDE